MNVDWGLAGAVILSGLAIVFLILIILILAVVIVNKFVAGVSKKNAAANVTASPPKPVAAPVHVAPAASSPAPVVQSGIAGETVAAISAAVSAYMDEAAPGVAYSVKSVEHAATRPDNYRPVWGFAGMRQNTRPF